MALKFRRGNASQKSGSLSFGEPYVNTDLNTLQIGGASGDITLATTGDNASFDGLSVSASSFISASSLYVSGNIEVGGTVDGIDISTFSSSVNSILGYLNSDTSSQDVRLDNLESKSASVDISVSNINTFSASALTRLSSLEVSASTSLSTNDAQDSSITNLNSFTSSINTTIKSKLDADGVVSGSSQIILSSTNGFTSYSSSVDSRITTEKGRVDAILASADANYDTFAEIVTLINSVDLTNDQAFAAYYTSSNGRLTNLESTSASVNTSVSNLNSFTSSINTIIKSKLDVEGVVSGSSQVIGILSSLNTYTGSNDSTNSTQNTRLTALEASASTALSTNNTQATSITNLNSFSSSALTRLSNLEGTDISITLTGDVTGTGTITNLGNVSFATTVAANSVALGTDTTGDYVASLVAGTGVSLSNNSGEGATPTIAIGQAVATSSSPTFAGLTINGAITATGDITAYYSSDKRFKSNIQLIPNSLEKVSKLNGVTWTWNDDVNEVTKSTPNTGLIAQEVQEVLPEVVMEREDGHLGLDYSKMVGLLVEAIKEQQTQIHNLTLEVQKLKESKGL